MKNRLLLVTRAELLLPFIPVQPPQDMEGYIFGFRIECSDQIVIRRFAYAHLENLQREYPPVSHDSNTLRFMVNQNEEIKQKLGIEYPTFRISWSCPLNKMPPPTELEASDIAMTLNGINPVFKDAVTYRHMNNSIILYSRGILITQSGKITMNQLKESLDNNSGTSPVILSDFKTESLGIPSIVISLSLMNTLKKIYGISTARDIKVAPFHCHIDLWKLTLLPELTYDITQGIVSYDTADRPIKVLIVEKEEEKLLKHKKNKRIVKSFEEGPTYVPGKVLRMTKADFICMCLHLKMDASYMLQLLRGISDDGDLITIPVNMPS
jgi:hypothetical protein